MRLDFFINQFSLFLQNHMIPSPTPEEKVTGNYLLVSSSHIICYKHPHRVDLVVPLQQVSSFKLSKTCDYCVMVSRQFPTYLYNMFMMSQSI